ncbi:MAG: hypothetical protein HRU49_07310 [Winogradskyella sp.]|uniref:hypothetical protein n=1 Tax=Winogradskyella sp. TaxID=1883156 RepID=UPI0025D05B54|nr:hypothetical protein [Winogradskyella sp.]NRB83567.1 hypothetical protein [Winogradskyella sp.]
MKKSLALMCLFSLLTAFTCENESLDDNIDTSSNTNNNDLMGSWNLLELEASVSSSISFQGQELSSEVYILSTDVAYVLSFTQSNFSTEGGYSYTADIVANGMEFPGESYTIDNVMGSGAYSTNGNEMTIDGSFFEFSFEDIDFSQLQGEQTLNFQISEDGQMLTFFQDETTTETDVATGSTTTSVISSTSSWSRE